MGRTEEIDDTGWPESGPYRDFLEFLRDIHRANGLKSRRAIARAMNLGSPSYINDMLRARRPIDARHLKALVEGLGGGDDEVRRAGRLLQRALREGGEPRRSSRDRHAWGDHVAGHTAWRLVGTEQDASGFKEPAIAIAGRLAALSADAEEHLADDPWLDPTLAVRFGKQTDWLLRVPLAGSPVDLSPAEAALLTLLPLLHHTHMVRTLATLSALDPLDLGAVEGAGPERNSYEAFCRGQRELVSRARAPVPAGRVPADTEIGWWLFHRWAARYPEAYQLEAIGRLLAATKIADPLMRDEVLATRPVWRCLSALRLGPAELADTERRDAPEPSNILFRGDNHEQRVRELLLSSLLAVAHAITVDLVRLPDVIVRHLGIPNAVDLGRVRETVTGRTPWASDDEGSLVLHADCHHAAEWAGLRQYAAQVDTMLAEIRRAGGHHLTLNVLTRLPSRAVADKVRADLGKDGRPLFERVSGFRLDERRVQGLLMGENLYQDRGLAIRELYQNALDACRWLQARLAFRSPGADGPWTGRIRFDQGVDRDGRAYLRCRDNGIGMTETVLTEVFSQAGAQFTDLQEFVVESAGWKNARPPIPFFPNSRFGIGVLSYFMIADEIEVVTQPMRRGPHTDPAMRVSIFGPGHLFQIEHLDAEPWPGTSVTLYLRDGEDAPSCVEELRRLLGIAEFETEAEHDGQREHWERGVLNGRARPAWETQGLNAHGTRVAWADKQGGQVVWCEHGGGLLVDGLYVRPAVRRGVFAGRGEGELRGAVVNLTGPYAPDDLSVDRRQVLSDVSERVESLLREASGKLMTDGQELLDVRWISAVTDANPRLADLITEKAIETRQPLKTRTGRLRTHETGFFLQDAHVVLRGDKEPHSRLDDEPFSLWKSEFGLEIPDHVLIWRLIAHNARDELDALGVGDEHAALLALPSDALVLARFTEFLHSGRQITYNPWHWRQQEIDHHPGHILWMSLMIGASPREVAKRAGELGIHGVPPACFDPAPLPDHVDLTMLSQDRSGEPLWADTTEPVPVGHLAAVALQFGMGITQVRDRMERFGFQVSAGELTCGPLRSEDLRLLHWSATKDHWSGWARSQGRPLPAAHIIQAAARTGLSVDAVCERLTSFGLQVERLALPEAVGESDRKLFDWDLHNEEREGFDSRRPLAPRHLLKAAAELGLSPREVAHRLNEYGIEVPRVLPQRSADDDERLLSRGGDTVRPPWPAGASISLSSLLVISKRNAVEPRVAADRLAEYGMVVPTGDLPSEVDDLTYRLLFWDVQYASPSEQIDSTVPVPYGHFIRASVELGLPPRDSAERLAECGMMVPDDVPGQAEKSDIRLLYSVWPSSRTVLAFDEPVPLVHILRAAKDNGTTVREAVDQLRWLGMQAAPLEETLAAALRRLPRP